MEVHWAMEGPGTVSFLSPTLLKVSRARKTDVWPFTLDALGKGLPHLGISRLAGFHLARCWGGNVPSNSAHSSILGYPILSINGMPCHSLDMAEALKQDLLELTIELKPSPDLTFIEVNDGLFVSLLRSFDEASAVQNRPEEHLARGTVSSKVLEMTVGHDTQYQWQQIQQNHNHPPLMSFDPSRLLLSSDAQRLQLALTCYRSAYSFTPSRRGVINELRLPMQNCRLTQRSLQKVIQITLL